MVTIINKELPLNMYGTKCPFLMLPEMIVVHNTANDASAENEIKYMQSNSNETSFHYAVDDTQIVQGIPLNRNAWHAGDGGTGAGNRKGIGIEICYSLSGGDRFIKAEENAAELCAYLLKQYGWGLDKVTKHQDYSNKRCPHRTLDMGWERFVAMVKDKLNEFDTIYNGMDYADVYDRQYYHDRYPDLQEAFGDDEGALIRHFVDYGMAEGRRAKEDFDVTAYRERYSDLQNVFGSSLKDYYLHYIWHGKTEGRIAV